MPAVKVKFEELWFWIYCQESYKSNIGQTDLEMSLHKKLGGYGPKSNPKILTS